VLLEFVVVQGDFEFVEAVDEEIGVFGEDVDEFEQGVCEFGQILVGQLSA
jgi:hypothetical protein